MIDKGFNDYNICRELYPNSLVYHFGMAIGIVIFTEYTVIGGLKAVFILKPSNRSFDFWFCSNYIFGFARGWRS